MKERKLLETDAGHIAGELFLLDPDRLVQLDGLLFDHLIIDGDLLVDLAVNERFQLDKPVVLVRVFGALCAVRIVVLRDALQRFPCAVDEPEQGFYLLVDPANAIQILFSCRWPSPPVCSV